MYEPPLDFMDDAFVKLDSAKKSTGMSPGRACFNMRRSGKDDKGRSVSGENVRDKTESLFCRKDTLHERLLVVAKSAITQV
ncbi:hypothetical protein PG993_011746 [Apiospora rasikravindrae]|uniref:Uncharacterized protein n=1 Tax=Apiospora rasikravindrae TaxID=990691 RepID=A0ABR1S0J4_9PEZI